MLPRVVPDALLGFTDVVTSSPSIGSVVPPSVAVDMLWTCS
jgi:hypothetical protein